MASFTAVQILKSARQTLGLMSRLSGSCDVQGALFSNAIATLTGNN
jgi:hypothetical protein